MRRGVTPSNFPREGSQGILGKGFVPANFRSVRPPYQHRNHDFPSNYRRDRPPEMRVPLHQKPRPNFVIVLRSDRGSSRKDDVRSLIDKCNSKPEDFSVFQSGIVAGHLFFRQWTDALQAMVCLWELRLDGIHCLTPSLVSNVLVASDSDELKDRLRTLFAERVEGYIKGDVLQKWQQKLNHVLDGIAEVSASLKKLNRFNAFDELTSKKKGLAAERELIAKRIKEFKSAMGCILGHLTGKMSQECSEEAVEVFRFDGDFNWCRIYRLIMREFRRLDDNLPIYAVRQEVLRHIYSEQIMVLIGETGSGKSTQLVQFLADSEFADGSIICTQPRKIAAMSLADRVKEESSGCYEDNSIMFSSTYSSSQ